MRSDWLRLGGTWLLLGALAAPVLADVFSSEFSSEPVSEGWDLIQQLCAEACIDDGWYYQRFGPDVCPSASAGQDAYFQSITEFNGNPDSSSTSASRQTETGRRFHTARQP